MRYMRFIVVILICLSCSTSKKIDLINYDSEIRLNKNNNSFHIKDWYIKDIQEDGIPGISLEKAKRQLSKNVKNNEVIVAVIDDRLDIKHEAISQFIWNNTKEKKGNGIDDDYNGYIDDINGWNFLGNDKKEQLIYTLSEEARIVRFYNDKFKEVDSTNISSLDKEKYDLYKKAKKVVDDKVKESKEEYIAVSPIFIKKYKEAVIKINPYLKEQNFTLQSLDSLQLKRESLKPYTSFISQMIEYEITLEDLEQELQTHINRVEKYYNIEYDDRLLLADSLFAHDINYINYGNNDIIFNTKEDYSHSTHVVSAITNVINHNVKIMPLCISAYGDEHDKDIALAIRYAVDNGASIINMSSSKYFSLHEFWVKDALKYAESKNVLFVTSAGNKSQNLDKIKNYPNDTDSNNNEVLSNFIVVGASTHHVNEKIMNESSNFGKKEVDVFAPGDSLYLASSSKDRTIKYEYVSGTSFATPIVSGIAALILSHYPSLTASQVKQIIMDSGVEYNFSIKINEEKTVPFNDLSKSGKIVNTYNAFIIADSIYNNQNKTK